MKTAYELAMERLNTSAPMTKLTEAQKKEIAELDSKYAAKVAEREIVMKGEIDQAAGAGDWEKVESLKQQLSNERKKMQSDLEDKKDHVRQAKKRS